MNILNLTTIESQITEALYLKSEQWLDDHPQATVQFTDNRWHLSDSSENNTIILTIQIVNNHVLHYDCLTPGCKNSKPCYHCIACILLIRKQTIHDPKPQSKNNYNQVLRIKNLVDKITQKEFQLFLHSYAGSDKRFKVELFFYFADLFSENTDTNIYHILCQKYFPIVSQNNININRSRVRDFIKLSNRLLDRAEFYLIQNNHTQAFDLTTSLMVHALQIRYSYQSDLHQLDEIIIEWHIFLISLLDRIQSPQLKESCFAWLQHTILSPYYKIIDPAHNLYLISYTAFDLTEYKSDIYLLFDRLIKTKNPGRPESETILNYLLHTNQINKSIDFLKTQVLAKDQLGDLLDRIVEWTPEKKIKLAQALLVSQKNNQIKIITLQYLIDVYVTNHQIVQALDAGCKLYQLNPDPLVFKSIVKSKLFNWDDLNRTQLSDPEVLIWIAIWSGAKKKLNILLDHQGDIDVLTSFMPQLQRVLGRHYINRYLRELDTYLNDHFGIKTYQKIKQAIYKMRQTNNRLLEDKVRGHLRQHYSSRKSLKEIISI